MTVPYWWTDPDKQPGDHITAARPRRMLVRVIDNPLTAVPRSPRRKLMILVIMPAVVTAVIMAVLIAQSTGLL